MIQETNEERALADDLSAYVNDKHTQEECIGFIDGYKSALVKSKNLRLADVVGQSEQLNSFDKWFNKEWYPEEYSHLAIKEYLKTI
jgi:hypothetical protein